jgi:two-component system phosphate regulon response regulator PhoB
MTKRALVCEDDDSIRLLLDRILTRYGIIVDSVRTGAEAMARLRREPYDLVLLDLLTPVMSGYQVIDVLLRERPDLLRRVVIVTGLQRAFREAIPVAGIIPKPFDLAELSWAIESILSQRSGPRRHPRRAEGELP